MILQASPIQAEWYYRHHQSMQNDITGITNPGRMILQASPIQAEWYYRHHQSRQNDITGVTNPGRIILQASPICAEWYYHHLIIVAVYQTATLEYSSPTVCLWVCVSVCPLCVHDNSKNNGSIHLKLEYTVVYKIVRMSSTLGIVWSRSRSRSDFEIFAHLPQYKLSRPISQLWHKLGSCNKVYLLI